MSPRKKTAAKKSLKRPCYDDSMFQNGDAKVAYSIFYRETDYCGEREREREVNLEALSNTFILDVFKDHSWTPLLTGFTKVYDTLI